MKFVDDDDDDDIKYYTLVFCLSLNCTVMQLKKSEQNWTSRLMGENILSKNTPCLTAKFTILLLHLRYKPGETGEF